MFKVLHNIPLSHKQKGMVCAFLGYTSFGFSDTIAKWGSEHYSVFQIMASNYLIASIVILLLAPILGGFQSALDKDTLKLQALRGVFNFLGSICVMYSLSIMPIANVYTMIFAMPFFAVLFAVPLYKETLHLNRMIVLAVGFIGIVVAFQPWVNGFDLNLFYPLAAAAVIALMFTTARGLKPDITLFALGVTPLITGLCIVIIVALLIQNIPSVSNVMSVSAEFKIPLLSHTPLLIMNGLFVCGGVILVSQGFRMVAAALAAPFIYSEMIWALLFGYFVFHDVPSTMMMVGALIIIGAGWYLVKNET